MNKISVFYNRNFQVQITQIDRLIISKYSTGERICQLMRLLIVKHTHRVSHFCDIPKRLLYSVEHFCYSEQVIPRIIVQSGQRFSTQLYYFYDLQTVLPYRAEIFGCSAFIYIKIRVTTLSEIKQKENQLVFCRLNFPLAKQLKLASQLRLVLVKKPYIQTKLKQNLFFVHLLSLRLIRSHLVVLSKYVVPDLHLILLLQNVLWKGTLLYRVPTWNSTSSKYCL